MYILIINLTPVVYSLYTNSKEISLDQKGPKDTDSTLASDGGRYSNY